METSNSTGHDEVSAAAIKHGVGHLHGPITHIVNLSITTESFANKWKIGRLLPLHKGKGLPLDDPESYRPISLLPVLSKITERALQPQIMEYMCNTGQLNENIHSYRGKHSTTTALLQLSNDIFENCNQNKISTAVTIDQSAAFDVIQHNNLLRKLETYGFSESAVNWVRSYLTSRSQYVTVGTRQSDYWSVENGVPQGSVLGPILYIIYVNEMPSVVNDPECQDPKHADTSKLFTDNCDKCGSIPTYADDSTYLVATKTRYEAQVKISENLDRIKKYLDSNSLSMNLGKTEILEVMVRQKRTRLQGAPPQLSVMKPDGQLKVIIAKESCRLLGANLNLDMTWKHHLELGDRAILPVIRSQMGALKHLAHFMPRKSRLLLANGLVLSKLIYLIPMWGGVSKMDTKKLQILLNKCARTVTGLARKTRTRTLMTTCNWLYFSELVIFHSLLAMWKMLRWRTPYHLSQSVSLDDNNLATTTDSRIMLVKNSYKWRTVQHWNSLSQDLREELNLRPFKVVLRRYLVDSRPPVVQRRVQVMWD